MPAYPWITHTVGMSRQLNAQLLFAYNHFCTFYNIRKHFIDLLIHLIRLFLHVSIFAQFLNQIVAGRVKAETFCIVVPPVYNKVIFVQSWSVLIPWQTGMLGFIF